MLYELKWVGYLDKGLKTIRLFDINGLNSSLLTTDSKETIEHHK